MAKSDQYLLIQNNGEAPVEGYTTLGFSSTRNCGVQGVIGQFGSGAKHAVNLCLRNNLPVWVYCGTTRLEFGLEHEIIKDGTTDVDGDPTETAVFHVTYRKGNNKNFKRAGWVLDFGVLDWDNVGMALREFISNAIDRTLREGGGLDANNLSIKIVDDSDRKARGGSTRVYVGVNDEVREYFGQLGKRFLHFSDTGDATPGLLPKANRNLDGEGAVIYREGVYIRELSGVSLFDYNFSGDEIKIDESRNSSEYAVKAACARKLGSAPASILAEVFRSELTPGDPTFESTLDQDYVFGAYGSQPNETQAETWTRAWEAAAGPDTVVCDNSFSYDYVDKKGRKPRLVTSAWSKSLGKIVDSASTVLDSDEAQGRQRLAATPFAIAAVDWAWELFEVAGLVGDREAPDVFCFQEIMKAGCLLRGYKSDDGVHIHVDIANDGLNNELRKTAIEEVAHWITGASDNSRDFQNFLIDALVGVAA